MRLNIRWAAALALLPLAAACSCGEEPVAEATLCTGPADCPESGLCGADGACARCDRGADACGCQLDGTCAAGLRCASGVCEACPAGERDCACAIGDSCGTGLTCQSGRCVACTTAIPGCPCVANTCTGGLVCDGAASTCRAAIPCSQAGCLPNQACQDATPGSDARCLFEECVPGYRWSATLAGCEPIPGVNCTAGETNSILADCEAQQRACEATATGAECTTCLPGFVDEAGALQNCRAVKLCSELACADQHRECTAETLLTDATCGACVSGYVDEGGQCLEEYKCDATATRSLSEVCAGRHRACVDATGGAACGDCLDGFHPVSGSETCRAPTTCGDCAFLMRECPTAPGADGGSVDPAYVAVDGGWVQMGCGPCQAGLIPSNPSDLSSACRPKRTCAPVGTASPADAGTDDAGEADAGEGVDSGVVDDRLHCPEPQVCVEGATGDATCVSPTCPSNQAWSDFQKKCVDCVTCNATGQTGAIWPFTTKKEDRCLCQTKTGYYTDTAGTMGAKPCDSDNDGWVRLDARGSVESTDPAIRSNARCDVRIIDRFRLENDFQQGLDILLCEGTPAAVRADDPARVAACKRRVVALYEPEALDNAQSVAVNDKVAVYGTRKPAANELNPLTKACVTEDGDFNANQLADLDEWQQDDPAEPFRAFAYFVELHKGWYEQTPRGLGRYIVRERSRCESAFPLNYGSVESSDYWRNCSRRRDSTFTTLSPGDATVGLDFAGWSCLDSGCAPVRPPIALPIADNLREPPNHGVCEVAMPPPDGLWRGMHHHSQFKCVTVQGLLPTDPAKALRTRLPTSLWDGVNDQPELFNRCSISAGAGESLGTELNPTSPVVTCTAVPQTAASVPAVPASSVGFVVERFEPSVPYTYTRGCISEWDEPQFKRLCPGFELWGEPITMGGSESSLFGRLACGCSEHVGGLNCEIGCPTSDRLISPGYTISPRRGYWLCGHTAASGAVMSGGNYTLQGEISTRVQPTEKSCNGGYCLSP